MFDNNSSFCQMPIAYEKFAFTICLIQALINFKPEFVTAHVTGFT